MPRSTATRKSLPKGHWTKAAVCKDARKYKSKAEWIKTSASAYAIAHRNGWVEQACRHMDVLWVAKWDHAAVLKSAKAYETRSQWKSSEPGAYKAALRNGWLAEASAHMATKRREWDIAALKESAQRFSTRAAWKESDGAAYKAARDHCVMDEVCAHMTRAYKPTGWWTKERVLASAREHQSIASWDSAETTAYQRAKQNGWMEEATAHMNAVPMPIGPATIHEFLLAHGIAYKAEHRFRTDPVVAKMPFDFYLQERRLLIEFHGRQHRDGWSRDPASREYIQRNDRIKREWATSQGLVYLEICAWIDRSPEVVRTRLAAALGGDLPQPRQLTAAEQRKVWSGRVFEEDEILADAAKYRTRAEWMRGSPNAYRFALRHGLDEVATAHMNYVTQHGKWTREAVVASALAHSSLSEWRKAEPSAYVTSKRLGCFDEATKHMKRAKQPNGYWTNERLIAEAARFDSTAHWQKESSGSYSIAKKRGLVPPDMARSKKPNGFWTKERVATNAANYTTRGAFRKAEPSAYAIASASGWLDEVCAHMQMARPG